MDYEIYHDESKEHGYWHGVLLVPTATKPLIIQHLKQVRDRTKHQEPLCIKNVRSFGKVFNCAEAWLDFGIGSFIKVVVKCLIENELDLTILFLHFLSLYRTHLLLYFPL